MRQALLRPPQAAKRLAICVRSLWELTNRGDLPCIRLGRSVRYDPADLEQWIELKKPRKSIQPEGALAASR